MVADSFNEHWDVEWMARRQTSQCYTQHAAEMCQHSRVWFQRRCCGGAYGAPSGTLFCLGSLITVPCATLSPAYCSQVSGFLYHPLSPNWSILFSFFFSRLSFCLASCFFCLAFILLSLNTRRYHHTSTVLLPLITNQPSAITRYHFQASESIKAGVFLAGCPGTSRYLHIPCQLF